MPVLDRFAPGHSQARQSLQSLIDGLLPNG